MSKVARSKSIADRVHAKTIAVGECLIWTGVLNKPGGYGQITIAGRRVRVHRLVWESEHGPITDGLSVLHRCDTPACVRVEHLFLGTQADNIRDAISKGRMRGAHAGGAGPGEANGRAVLTDDAVREIRRRRASGERVCDLARAFSVSSHAIHYVTHGGWRHVDADSYATPEDRCSP